MVDRRRSLGGSRLGGSFRAALPLLSSPVVPQVHPTLGFPAAALHHGLYQLAHEAACVRSQGSLQQLAQGFFIWAKEAQAGHYEPLC